MTLQLSGTPVDREVTGSAFRRFMRGWPGGIAIITTGHPAGPVGCTVNSLMSVSLNPPLLLISLAQDSRTLSAITEAGAFGINVLSWQQRHLAIRFATMRNDRFASVAYTLRHGVPVLDAATAAAVCTLDRLVPAADHMLLLGHPCWCDDDGSYDPVIFFRSTYRALRRPA